MAAELVIYGAGGFAREVAQLVDDANAGGARWNLLGFLTDDAAWWRREIAGLPVLGGAAWLEGRNGLAVAMAIGSPATRRQIVRALDGLPIEHPVLVHPTANVGKRTVLEPGSIVTAGAIVTTDGRIGRHSCLNLACTVGHDCQLGDFVTIAPGANLSGNVRIGEGSDIGTGAAIIQGVEIGAWSVVGAGAAVVADLPADCTAVGVPAKVIKQREPGWHERA